MIAERDIRAARETPLTNALDIIGATRHPDNTYRPKRETTQLLLIENQGNHFEMIITEPKFVLRRRGQRDRFAHGGGAIDLVMALTGCSFPAAVRLLLKNGDR